MKHVLRVIPEFAYFAICMITVLRFAGTASDYEQDYVAGHALLRSLPIYSGYPNMAEGLSVPGRPLNFYNDHPAFLVVALSPLSHFDYSTAFIVLGVLLALAFRYAIKLATELAGIGSIGAWLSVLLAFAPCVHAALAQGSLSLIITALVTIAWCRIGDDAKSGQFSGGASLATAVALKLSPAVLLVVPALRRMVWFLFGFALTLGLLVLLTFGFVGLSDLEQYFRSVLPLNTNAYLSHGFNLSLPGAAHRIFGNINQYSPWIGRWRVDPALASQLGLSASLLCLISYFWVARRLKDKASCRPLFVGAIYLMLLLTPLTWHHAYSALIVPGIVLLASYLRSRESLVLFRLLLCGIAFFFPEKPFAEFLISYSGQSPLPWYYNLPLLLPLWSVLILFVLQLAEIDKLNRAL